MTKSLSKRMNLIVACDSKMGIGKNGDLPWRLPNEFKYFTAKTTTCTNDGLQNAVIMGRKCWESIPPKFRPLKNRLNVVISRTMQQGDCENVLVYDDFDKAVSDILEGGKYKDKIETIWNVGGSEIYRMGLNSTYFDKLYLTQVNGDFNCEVFFPPIDLTQFNQVILQDTPKGVQIEKDIQYEFKVYERKC